MIKEVAAVTVVSPLYGSLSLYLSERYCLDDALELARCLRPGTMMWIGVFIPSDTVSGQRVFEWEHTVKEGYDQ